MLVWPRLPGAPNVKTRLRCVISLYMGGLKVEYPFMSCGQHTALFRNVQTGHLSTLSSPLGCVHDVLLAHCGFDPRQ